MTSGNDQECESTGENVSMQVVSNVLKVMLSSPILATSIGHGADPGFLAVSPQVTLVINLVVGCRFFPLGLRLLTQ